MLAQWRTKLLLEDVRRYTRLPRFKPVMTCSEVHVHVSLVARPVQYAFRRTLLDWVMYITLYIDIYTYICIYIYIYNVYTLRLEFIRVGTMYFGIYVITTWRHYVIGGIDNHDPRKLACRKFMHTEQGMITSNMYIYIYILVACFMNLL